MRSIGRILLWLIGGLAVVAMSFFVTSQILDFRLSPQDSSTSVIHVVDATYGASCKDFAPPPPHTNTVAPGNVTASVAQVCDQARASCSFAIDVNRLGDPADGCGKDFVASWRCGTEQKTHQFYLSPEASGRTVLFSCPAP